MPSIQITLTDDQYQKMIAHIQLGQKIEFAEETTHGIEIILSEAFALWFLDVKTQAGNLDLDTVNVKINK
jgi:hypothetical protein